MTEPADIGVRPGSTFWSAVTLVARLALGGVFLFAAYTKLQDPMLFGQAIMKFKLTTPVEHDHLVKVAAFAIPWIEALCGVGLILGAWTRASALILVALLGFFIYAILGVLSRGETFKCSCFGRLKLACGDELSRCNLWQNGALIAIGLAPLVLGGGRWSLDRLLRRRPQAVIVRDDT